MKIDCTHWIIVDEVDLYIHVRDLFREQGFPRLFPRITTGAFPADQATSLGHVHCFGDPRRGGVRIHNGMALYCM